MFRIPRLVKWVSGIVLFFLMLLTAFRFIVYIQYKPSNYPFPMAAFLMGLRVDIRSACILGLFILLLCSIRFFNPFRNNKAIKFWNVFLAALFFIVMVFFVTDYFHYDYLHQRLNASVLNYLKDAGISLSMVWQTYPVVRILAGIAILLFLSGLLFARMLRHYVKEPSSKTRFRAVWLICLVLLLMAGTWGSLGQFPLRWSTVYTLGDAFQSQIALNPFQSFASTLSFKNVTYDIKKVRGYYPLMADYLGVQVPDPNTLNFQRAAVSPDTFTSRPNVVLVICESFSAYKSSMWGNPLNTTPFFDSLSKQGVFFDHCFTPSYGTARGVWATVTGLPDVEAPSTASRNPNIVDQHTIINAFSGYEKYYFIGGNAAWANIRGLLKNNIKGLHLYEQDDYGAKKVDVWGVSDKNLFLASAKILQNQQKPFFAIIQTADNHRPYTIPKEDMAEFHAESLPTDTLKKYGFVGNDEFNAFRYTDFCYRKFIEAAKASPFFRNTVFVFVGDHGIRGDAANMLPRAWTEQALTTVHVPLLFYAPGILSPARKDNICSQLDILPSLAGLLSIPYINTAMGRNLFDTSLQKDRFRYSSAFVVDPDEKKIGMISDDYYLRKMRTTGAIELVSIKNNDPLPAGRAYDSIKNKLSTMADAYYYTAQYLLYHNKNK